MRRPLRPSRISASTAARRLVIQLSQVPLDHAELALGRVGEQRLDAGPDQRGAGDGVVGVGSDHRQPIALGGDLPGASREFTSGFAGRCAPRPFSVGTGFASLRRSEFIMLCPSLR